jgi:hypothetical protein
VRSLPLVSAAWSCRAKRQARVTGAARFGPTLLRRATSLDGHLRCSGRAAFWSPSKMPLPTETWPYKIRQ